MRNTFGEVNSRSCRSLFYLALFIPYFTISTGSTASEFSSGSESHDFQRLFTRVADHVVVILAGDTASASGTIQGSGFVLPGSSRVITVAHLITGPDIQIVLKQGSRFPAQLIRKDQEQDLALLEITGFTSSSRQNIPFVWSTDGLEGREVAAISSPKGLDFSLVQGMISSVSRRYRGFPALQAQLEAAPGSSGGPVFLKDGRFLGLIAGRIPDQPWFSVIIPAPSILEFLVMPPGSPGITEPLSAEVPSIAPADAASDTDMEALRWYNAGVSATDSEQKITCYRKAVSIRDSFFEGWFNLGTALSAAGAKKDAAEAYRKALQLRPDSTEAIRNLGRILLDLGQLDEAISIFGRAVTTDAPANVYNDLGVALKRAGRYEEAESVFRQAIARNPAYAPAHYNLAICLVHRGNTNDAARAFEAYLTADPGAADAETVRQWILNLQSSGFSE